MGSSVKSKGAHSCLGPTHKMLSVEGAAFKHPSESVYVWDAIAPVYVELHVGSSRWANHLYDLNKSVTPRKVVRHIVVLEARIISGCGGCRERYLYTAIGLANCRATTCISEPLRCVYRVVIEIVCKCTELGHKLPHYFLLNKRASCRMFQDRYSTRIPGKSCACRMRCARRRY